MMRRRTLVKAIAAACSVPALATAKLSRIKADERVVLFDTDARFDAERRRWQVPIHGWVHELERAALRRASIERLLATKYDIEVDPSSQANFARRVGLLIADNERNKRLAIRIGERQIEGVPTGPNGHFRFEIELDDAFVERHAVAGGLPVAAVAPGLSGPVSAAACLIPNAGVSVISDIDDTVKISEVTDRKRLLENSLLRDFAPAPGMAALYRHWAGAGASFHFVSSSPWHFYEPLKEFLQQAGFPAATLSLKMIRFKDASIANLWRDGAQTKPAQIEPILRAYPKRRFVLVGDSGEQDPQVYGAMARKYPEQVERIYIRNVTDASADQARFIKAFAGVAAESWRLFDDPQTLATQL